MHLVPHLKTKACLCSAAINNVLKRFVAKHKVVLASFSNYFARTLDFIASFHTLIRSSLMDSQLQQLLQMSTVFFVDPKKSLNNSFLLFYKVDKGQKI